jgi:hypothetical protein
MKILKTTSLKSDFKFKKKKVKGVRELVHPRIQTKSKLFWIYFKLISGANVFSRK